MQNRLDKFNKLPLLAIIISCLLLVCFAAGFINPLDNLVYDGFMSLKISDIVNKDIVIIKIDSKSIENLDTKRWPWGRDMQARLLELVLSARPAVVGVNILFTGATNKDKELINILKRNKNVVMAFVNEKGLPVMPVQGISQNSTVADITLVKDKDGIIRYAYSGSSTTDEHYKSFAGALSDIFKPGITLNLKGNRFLINYINLTKSFLSYSALDIFRDHKLLKNLRGKIVLVGVTSEGVAGILNTPVSNKLEYSLSGTELQAHIINTIVTGKYINQVDFTVVVILLPVVSVLLEMFLRYKKASRQVFIVGAFIVIPVILSFVLFKYCLIWLSPSVFLISAVIIYLVYSLKTFLKIDKTVNKAIDELSEDTFIPVPDVTGRIEKGVATLTELSQVINRDRQMIRAIIDAINSPVVVFDALGLVTWRNHKAKQLKMLREILSLTELGFNLGDLQDHLADKYGYQREIVIDNREYLIITTFVVEGESLYVSIFNDVTDLKDIDRLKTDLIRTVSHEIRTPMTVIQSYCDLALELRDDELVYEYISKISTKTEELTLFLSEFLDLSRLEANMSSLNITDINLQDILTEVFEDNKIFAQQKNINIILIFESIGAVQGDDKRLKQAFTNLLSNAIKYSPENTEIKILLEEEKEVCRISISDQGFGIPVELQSKVFEKFYRIYSEETKNVTGTGLGLAITKKIVEMHAGEISLIAESVAGSKFVVMLPFNIPENGIEEF